MGTFQWATAKIRHPWLSDQFEETVKQQGANASYFTRLIRLTFLAPGITQAVLEGRHPVERNGRVIC